MKNAAIMILRFINEQEAEVAQPSNYIFLGANQFLCQPNFVY